MRSLICPHRISHPFHGMWPKAQSRVFKHSSVLTPTSSALTPRAPTPLSVLLNTNTNRHTHKWMVASWQLTFSPSRALLAPDSAGCGAAAWPEQGVCVCACVGGGVNHTVIQVLLTIPGPIWDRGAVSQGVGPRSYSQSVSMK